MALKKLELEQSATLKKLASGSLFEQNKVKAELEAERRKAANEQQKARAEAGIERRKATTEWLQELDAGAEAEMIEWLGRHRLSRHMDTIARNYRHFMIESIAQA